ncbi:MAG: SH3 domain protein [Psychrosphaera sp.]|jgi:SH3 domain protein
MDKKRIKLSLTILVCGLTLSNFIFATPTVEPTEPTPKTVTPTEKTNDEPQAATDVATTIEQTEEPVSSIVQVTPYQMYVTDQLFVFLHSGSSNRYRIIARVAASEQVTILSKDENTGWLEIKLKDGKTGWIDSTMLEKTAGVKAKLASANAQIDELNVKISKLGSVSTDDLKNLEDEITKLTETNAALSQQLITATQESETLRASIKESDETKRILAKLYDVGAIVIGVFVGWLLTRRKKNQWV